MSSLRKRRSGAKRLFIILGVVLLAGGIFVGGIVVGNYKNMGNFLKVYSTVHSKYLEPTSTTELMDGAMKGMVESLDDPYSSYLDAETYSYLREQIRGTFGGLGILVGIKDNYLTVVRAFEDTPASKGGIKAGDKIAAIDGKDAEGMDLETAVSMMRGPVGTEITLSLLRESQEQPVEVTIKREEISVPTVEGHMVKDTSVAHISVAQFNQKTPEELNAVLDKLKKKNMKSIVLDLRNNPGGELKAAKKIADKFIPRGPIVYVDYRSGKDITFKADDKYLDLPVVVLVNKNSASASEIVAGAIKDTDSGELVGTTTFGKGIVQTVFPLDNGAALKLTTARYLTPDKHNIHKKGIKPDVKVKLDKETRDDAQLQKALEILSN
ncbi:MAG: S41 family peptidase [Clostridiales bacterium]|nr:S41 family peptidase [Clostridiales bacterium]MCF8022890.1 S41 family peptidase [Clostridiales bacterium]